jgi:hypothetical protein
LKQDRQTMSDTHSGDAHANHGTAVADHPASGHHAAPVAELKFEKVELQEFLDADRGAGQHIGILMSGATMWTYLHQNASHDPHATSAPADHGSH